MALFWRIYVTIYAMSTKKHITDKKKDVIVAALITGAAGILCLLFLLGLFLLSANYQSIYSSPCVTKGKADFAGIDPRTRDTDCILSGDWEFFANRWIVTDCEEDAQPDGYLSVPGHWTGDDFGSGKLGKKGYASYRLTVTNLEPCGEIKIFRKNCMQAYRIFVNGKLNVRSGTVSDKISGTRVTGEIDELIPYETTGEPFTIVIELSATDHGGLTGAPWLSALNVSNYGSNLRNFTQIGFGVTTAAFLASLVMFLFFRYKRDYTVPLLMGALYVHFAVSKDIATVISLPYGFAVWIGLVSAIVSAVFLILHLKRTGAVFAKIPLITGGAGVAVMLALFFVLRGTDYAFLPLYLLILSLCSLCYPLLRCRGLGRALKAAYCMFVATIACVFTFELADVLGVLVYGTEFILTFIMMFVIVFFAVLGLLRMACSVKAAVRAGELERELFSARQQALKAQIKPHFVFNSLTTIQAMYRKSLDEGDKALGRFAGYLRLSIDSDGAELIPFEDEVKNVLNYFELENLRHGGVLSLLLDLDFTDFSVPVLSLQPLVENAVKHAGTQDVQDGCIVLYSKRTDYGIEVGVTDNGKGFDTSGTERGVGLGNVAHRFADLLHAEMSVESEAGKGTEVRIIIPAEEKKA